MLLYLARIFVYVSLREYLLRVTVYFLLCFSKKWYPLFQNKMLRYLYAFRKSTYNHAELRNSKEKDSFVGRLCGKWAGQAACGPKNGTTIVAQTDKIINPSVPRSASPAFRADGTEYMAESSVEESMAERTPARPPLARSGRFSAELPGREVLHLKAYVPEPFRVRSGHLVPLVHDHPRAASSARRTPYIHLRFSSGGSFRASTKRAEECCCWVRQQKEKKHICSQFPHLYLGPSTRCSCLPSIEIDAALLGDTDHDGVAVHNRLVHRPCLRVFSSPH